MTVSNAGTLPSGTAVHFDHYSDGLEIFALDVTTKILAMTMINVKPSGTNSRKE